VQNVNQVFLLGTSGKDAEFHATSGGTGIVTFSVATSERYKDASGNWQEKTEWHNVKAFGRTAEIAREKVQKGTKVFIEGKLTTESWDDKQSGQKKYKSVIVANYLSVVPSVRSASAESTTSYERRPAKSTEQILQSTELSEDDTLEIPF
jgi:single-strand DNA-binding protein